MREASALFGAYYGIVCDNRDPEQLGRIQVRLPWLDGGDVDVARWAQLIAPMASMRAGWYALPACGDVVVVMFVGGEVAQPVVVGGAWSTADAPPDELRTNRGYRSRSGHRLLLDDGAAARLTITDRSGDRELALGDGGVAIDARAGRLEVTAAGALTITAQRDVRIASASTLDVAAGGDATLEARSTTKLSATGAANLDAPKTRLA